MQTIQGPSSLESLVCLSRRNWNLLETRCEEKNVLQCGVPYSAFTNVLCDFSFNNPHWSNGTAHLWGRFYEYPGYKQWTSCGRRSFLHYKNRLCSPSNQIRTVPRIAHCVKFVDFSHDMRDDLLLAYYDHDSVLPKQKPSNMRHLLSPTETDCFLLLQHTRATCTMHHAPCTNNKSPEPIQYVTVLPEQKLIADNDGQRSRSIWALPSSSHAS